MDRIVSPTREWETRNTTRNSPPAKRYMFRTELHIFHPDTNARSKFDGSRTHLHYPSQKRWLPGDRGKQETTAQSPSRCSGVLPPSRMSSANNVLAQEPSIRPSSGRRARRRDAGKAKESTFSGPSSCPRESPTQLSIRTNHGKTSGRCIWLHVVPIRMSPWMTDDDPLTKIDNAAALSTMKPQRTPEPVRKVLE